MPCRVRRKPCIAAFRATRLTAEQRLERRAPSGSERLNVQRVLQPVAWMISEIEKRVDVGDSHSICRLTDFYDFVSSAYRAFPQNAQVESGPAAGCQQCRHPRLVRPDADAIAGNARLSDLEQCVANLITITDAYNVVGQSLDREVLAEL